MVITKIMISCNFWIFPQNHTLIGYFDMIFDPCLYERTLRAEFLRSSQKFCPSFHYEGKWKSYWEYDRTLVAPTYPVKAGIMSNVGPPSKVDKIRKITKKLIKSAICYLHISFLRIQVEHSSNTKK